MRHAGRQLFALTAVLAAAVISGAQTIEPPFDLDYAIVDLGVGVQGPCGGLTLKFDDPNTLIIAGQVTGFNGALYQAAVVRGEDNHITGFAGSPTVFVSDDLAGTKNVQTALEFGPGNVLFYTRENDSSGDAGIGEVKPGNAMTDKSAPLSGMHPRGLEFVPVGFPGAGQLKMRTREGDFVTLTLAPDASGTYDLTTSPPVSFGGDSNGGMAYVPPGSPNLADYDSILLSSYGGGTIRAWGLDPNGDPEPGTGVPFISGLNGPWGMTFDYTTGDLLVCLYNSAQVLAIRGFGAAAPTATPTGAPSVTPSATVTPVASPTPTTLPAATATPTGTATMTTAATATASPSETVTLIGNCQRPSATGLTPCLEGTLVTASKCTDRTCETLDGLGSATTAADGSYTLILDATRAARARLIIAAVIPNGGSFRVRTDTGASAGDVTTYRVIDLGPAAGGIHTNVDIGPASEAGVELLEQNGLANYTDARVVGVVATVEMANANTDFAGLTPEAAVQLAMAISLGSASVQSRLACGGDCDLNSSTAINELIIAVNIALGSAPVLMCEAADSNADELVQINELLEAVNTALNGCAIRAQS